MLALPYEGNTNYTSGSLKPVNLSPKEIYQVSERYAGQDESETVIGKFSGEELQRMVRDGTLRALRHYYITPSTGGAPRLLNHLAGLVERVLH